MIEKTLKTTTGKLRVKIPTHLNEVTLGQMIAMQEKPHLSDLDAISILSGIALGELKNVGNVQDFDMFGEAVISLANQIKHLYNSDDIPQTVTFIISNKKVVIKVIRNLSVEPAGAFMAAHDIIADEINKHIGLHGQENWEEYINPSLTACCQVLAHYFFCKATGKKYSEYEVEEFYETVKTLRVTEALPIAEVGIREKTGNNDGVRVETYLHYVGLGKGNPWCASFVCWAFGQSGIANPRSGYCPDLFSRKKVIYKRTVKINSEPKQGDV